MQFLYDWLLMETKRPCCISSLGHHASWQLSPSWREQDKLRERVRKHDKVSTLCDSCIWQTQVLRGILGNEGSEGAIVKGTVFFQAENKDTDKKCCAASVWAGCRINLDADIGELREYWVVFGSREKEPWPLGPPGISGGYNYNRSCPQKALERGL